MKVLAIDEWFPWPLESGKKIRSYNLISRLAADNDIIYLAYARIPEEHKKIQALQETGLRPVPVEDTRIKKWSLRFYIEVIFNLLSKKPFSTVYHIKSPFIEKMLQTIKLEMPDLIHCEWTNLAPFLEHIEGIPRVIAAHNVESDIWRRFAKNTRNPIIKTIAHQQARKIEALERNWYPRVDHCIAVSEDDGEIIGSYGAQVSVVDNGVDINYYDIDNSETFEGRIVFTASMDTFSNQDAVEFFINSIFYRLKKTNPEISFWVVGKDPPKKIRKYSSSEARVCVTGTVADVREYIQKSTICVVPLRIGGGSRLKILEAMAMGKPVVSTTIGAEGLRVKNGENIFFADEPDDFVAVMSKLLSEKELRRKVGTAGRELVKSEYGWKHLAKKQNIIWKKLVQEFADDS